MVELDDLILEGLFCQICWAYLGYYFEESPGFPQTCEDCQEAENYIQWDEV